MATATDNKIFEEVLGPVPEFMSIGEAEEVAEQLQIQEHSGVLIIRDHLRVTFPIRLADVSNSNWPLIKYLINCFLKIVKETDMVAVKIRGLPYQIRYEEIGDFFREHMYIQKSVILGVGADGRKNGFGSILFEDPETALIAVKELDGKYIGQRYAEISVLSYGDYLRFNGP